VTKTFSPGLMESTLKKKQQQNMCPPFSIVQHNQHAMRSIADNFIVMSISIADEIVEDTSVDEIQ
jgi:hypothetical protein